MFCTNCGNKLDNDSIFCTNCGNKVPKHDLSNKTRSWVLKVVGVTYNNNNGTSRQKLISHLKHNEPIKLSLYKYEGQDAIYVLNNDNQILGNIPLENTTEIRNKMKANRIQKIIVEEVDYFVNEKNKKVYYLKIKLFIKI